MLINCGNVGRLGGVKTQKNAGYLVSWVYAGGATVGSPATIWSENGTDANNQITVKYNGIIAWLTKIVAGVSTYCTVSVPSLAAGTYPVKIVLNADNTLQLTVNGVAASAGFGNEIWSPTDFSATGTWVTNDASITVNTTTQKGVFTASPTNKSLYRTTALTIGRIYHAEFTIDSISSGALNSLTSLSNKSTPGRFVYEFPAAGTSATITTAGVTTAVVDDATMKEVYNSTSTVAIPWATVL